MSRAVKVTDMNALIQSPSLSYMQQVKDYGTGFNFIKTSEGTSWPNTMYGIDRIKEMMRNSERVWGQFGVYHFWHGEDASAFLAWSKYYGLDPRTTKFMLDVEDPSTEYNIMARINRFFKQLIDHGYNKGNLFLYCMSSWVNDGIIVPSEMKYGFLWLAEYPYVSLYNDNAIKPGNPNKPNCNVWQFSGLGNQDWSYAYDGCLDSTPSVSKPKPKPKAKHKVLIKKPTARYLTRGREFEVIGSYINGYRDAELTVKNGWTLTKGSHLTGQILRFPKYTRLDTPHGWFSTNTKLLKAVK